MECIFCAWQALRNVCSGFVATSSLTFLVNLLYRFIEMSSLSLTSKVFPKDLFQRVNTNLLPVNNELQLNNDFHVNPSTVIGNGLDFFLLLLNFFVILFFLLYFYFPLSSYSHYKKCYNV